MSTPPLSLVRVHHGVAYTSGHVGMDPATGAAFPDFRDEVRAALAALGDALAGVGCAFHDVIRATLYITDAALFAAMNDEYVKVFAEPYPARTTLVTGLAAPSLRFEVDAVAAIPPG